MQNKTFGWLLNRWIFQVNCCSFVLQLENYIQDSMKQEIVQFQQAAVQNHTATMIEIGTNLLSQTAEQTRKLTNVEAQVSLIVRLCFPKT